MHVHMQITQFFLNNFGLHKPEINTLIVHNPAKSNQGHKSNIRSNRNKHKNENQCNNGTKEQYI